MLSPNFGIKQLYKALLFFETATIYSYTKLCFRNLGVAPNRSPFWRDLIDILSSKSASFRVLKVGILPSKLAAGFNPIWNILVKLAPGRGEHIRRIFETTS